MILACLHFVLAYFISYKSLGYLPHHLARTEKIAASAVLAPFLSAWITFATWILLGRVRGGGVSLIILTLITLILVLVRRPDFNSTQNEPLPTKSAHKALYAVFWLSLCLILGWLTYNHYLMSTVDGWLSSGYTWGDIAIHMSLASWFAKQPDLLLVWPIFKDTKMFYTFLADLGTAQLLSYGASYQLAFGLPTLSLLLGCTRLTFGLVYRLTRSLRASLIHINFVLFSGSAAGIMYALYDFLNPTRASIMPDYTNLSGDTQLNFANLITSHLLPQRSYLLGFGVTSLILIMVYQLYKRHRGESFAQKLSEKRLVFIIATLTGLLPFAHVHSFLVLMGVYVSILLWELFRRDRLIRDWLYILGISSLIALPQLYWQAITTPKGMTRTNFGWMMTEGSNIVWFWVLNLGLLLLFFILILWLLYSLLRNRHQHHTYHIRDTDSFTGILFGFGVTLFIAGNLIQFLPNIWDNMKFFNYGYLFMTIPVSHWIASWAHNLKRKIIAFCLIIIIIAPGVLAVYRDAATTYSFLTNSELELATRVEAVTPTDAVILTTSRHNHPVSTMTGRQIIMGYLGWLQGGFGYDMTPTQNDVAIMFQGSESGLALMKKYGVTHIVFSDTELTEFGINQAAIAQSTDLIDRVGQYYIYKLR